MLSAVANLGWIFVLCSIAIVFGICRAHRAQYTATRERHKGIQKPQRDLLVDEVLQEEEEFDDVEDVVMISDENDDPEPGITLPVRRPVAQATSQRETSIPSHTVQVNRKH
jgi:hypothetical protein